MIYIMPSCSEHSPGILKKNIQRVSAIKEQHYKIKGLFFTKDHNSVKEINEAVSSIGYSDDYIFKNYPLLWRLTPYYKQWKHIKVISCWIDKIRKEVPDAFIYLRYPGASLFAFRMLKKLKNKGVDFGIEMNGKEEAFLEKELKDNPNDFFAQIRLRSEKKYAPKMMKLTSLIVGVSHEISQYYSQKNSKSYVLSNGFDVSSVVGITQQISLDEPIKMVLISGSPNYWNGSDRYIQAFKAYSGQSSVELHLVGSFNANYLHDLPENIICHGILTKQELDQLLPQMHLGLGSCGMHRVDLNEGNVLKVREYVSRGLPICIGYQDTDLTKLNQALPFVFQISADEKAIHLDELIQWLIKLYTQTPGINKLVRAFAEEHLDENKKMKNLIEFIEKQGYAS